MNKERTLNESIRHARGLLTQMLPTTSEGLADALRASELTHSTIMQERIEAQAELYNRRLQYFHPKDKEMTDMDRKIHLEANVSEYQKKYELLAGLEKALELRIQVIRTLTDLA